MKGKIKKCKKEYEISCNKSNGNTCYMYILKEDMAEFMDDINRDWSKILTDKLNKALKPCKEE